MASVYFDSSVFLAIFNGEDKGDIKNLLRELKKEKIRIVTSIITIQEVAVLGYRYGTAASDNHSRVNKLARIHSITKDMALTAAKYEAHMIDAMPSNTDEAKKDKKRRKWDCFHMACAVHLKCNILYSLDPGMLKRKTQFNIPSISFMKPIPIGGVLLLEPVREDDPPAPLASPDSPIEVAKENNNEADVRIIPGVHRLQGEDVETPSGS